MNNQTPYADLDPNLILNAVESIGLQCSGSLLALNSYENRVYQIGLENNPPLIAKFYRPNRWSDEAILEEHRFSQELVEHEIPIVAPWVNNQNQSLHFYHGFRFALFQRWGGRALELDNINQLQWMGRFIGRLHAIGACRSFKHRPALDVKTHGVEPYHFLVNNDFLPSYLLDDYQQTMQSVLAKIENCFQLAGDIRAIRLHGDIHPGNILWNEEGPHIVDLDDCVMGPAIQDIWMMLSGDSDQVNSQLEHILHGYNQFYDFNYREIYLIEAMRTLRQIQYSAWLASRWGDPAFPKSFPWFNTPHYWEEQLRNLHEQNYSLEKTLARDFFRY